MPHVRTVTYGDEAPDIDLTDPDQVRAAERVDVVLALLRHTFHGSEDGVIGRRALIQQLVGSRPRTEREPAARRLAEAFQLLERMGLVCEDIEESRGDHWFLTGFGRFVLESSAARDELSMRFPR